MVKLEPDRQCGTARTGPSYGNTARKEIMDLTALPITHRAVIPDDYLDVMGHMNVMWYTHLFSLGAWGLFQMVGLNRAYFGANHAGSFALAQHFRYVKEVRAGQHVTIRSRVLGRSE